jgi:hypothetical protein
MAFKRGHAVIKPKRGWIGVATGVAVALFVANPEIFALSFVISSIGFDVFLLFLSFQLRDQIHFLLSFLKTMIASRQKRRQDDG